MSKKDINTQRHNSRKRATEKVDFEMATEVIQKDTSMKAGAVESKSTKK